MKHIICSVLLCIMVPVLSIACNSCGSSSAGQSLGLLPAMQKHFVGVQFQQRNFSSIHPALSETKAPETSEEYYITLQVWGRYNLNKKVQLFAFVPFQSNIQNKNGASINNSGIGDISVLANVVIIRTGDKKWNSTLIAGGGVKAPTGKRNNSLLPVNNSIPNMQPGSGAWDFVTNANYTLQAGKLGFNAEGSYTLTTTSENSYKYGNKLSAGILGFYKLQAGDLALMPQVGAKYEYALHDYDNYKRKWLNELTGGYQIFGSAGLQAYYKRTGLQLNYMLPITQQYAGGNVKALCVANAGLFILL